jgi:hypothetical protein
MEFDLSDLLPFNPDDQELAEIARLLPGNYNCLEQAERDSRSSIFRAPVHMHIVPAHIDGISQYGYAFYLEQTRVGYAPYRQRVYLVARDKSGRAINRTFDIKEPAGFIGALNNRELLTGLTAELLIEAKGCDVIWTRFGPNHYRGIAGEGGSCRTSYGGATHITVEIELTEGMLKTRDQGFNDDGVLIFGPTSDMGPYEFLRQTESVHA